MGDHLHLDVSYFRYLYSTSSVYNFHWFQIMRPMWDIFCMFEKPVSPSSSFFADSSSIR
jgi:hypothetical protein